MFDRLKDNPISSVAGLVVLIVGGILLALGKITFNEFLIFLAACGIGLGIKDPKGAQ